MADLKIKNIKIRNWMTIREADITFPEKGLILVLGSNLASDGKLQSVGSGKTGLGEALAIAMAGVKGRYSEFGYYAEDRGGKDMYVKVEASLLAKPLSVEMGFKCAELSKTGEGLKFTYGDKPSVQRGDPTQTRRELQKTIRITPELANWTVFVSGDRLNFEKMSQENSVNLVMAALAQPPWTEYFELAKAKLQAANKQLAVSAQALESAKMRADTAAGDLDEAVEEHKQAEEDYQRQVDQQSGRITELKQQNGADRSAIKAAEQEMAKIKKQLALLEEQQATQNHQWEIEKQNLRDDVAELDEKRLEAAEKRTAATTHFNGLNTQLAEMKKVPKNCPKCNKPWDKAHSEEEIAKIESALDKAEEACDKADAVYSEIDKKRRQINEQIGQLEQKMRTSGHVSDVRHLGDKYSAQERLIRSLNTSIHERELKAAKLAEGVDKSFVNKKSAVVEERTRALAKVKEAITTAASDLTMDEEVVKAVQYWYKAYGPTGIPNMILADAVPLMNRVAQRISALMTGSTLEVTYSTTRTLTGGETRQKLVTKVNNRIGSKRSEGSSKGEGGLTNLIIAENLNEIGQVSNRMGFRWYDEITNGQDSVVRRSIFAYLKEVAERLGILVFVVEHHPEIASFADYVLVAEKSREHGTRFFWR